MFRGILSLSLNLFYLETVAKGSKLNKTEEKIKKSRRTTWRSPLSPPGPALWLRPGPAHHRHLPVSSSSLPGGRARTRRARPRTPATSSLPGCLLLPWFPPATPRSPLGPLSLFLEAPPLCSFSLARTRTQPSPPTLFAADTIPLSPPRRLPELRKSSLVLLVVSRDQKSPGTPPRRFPPRRPPRIFSVEFGHSGAPPSSLTLPARSP